MQCLEKVAASNKPEDKFELTNIENGLTVERCIQYDLMVNQPHQKQQFISAIFVLIKRFSNLINTGKNLNEDQMIELSIDFYERFKCESLEDVALFLKKARSGEFGDFYRLDTVVMIKWIDQYMDKKAEAYERETINQENIRIRKENDEVAAHAPDEKAKANLEKLSQMLKGASKQNTGALKQDNPLFNYEAYCERLQNGVGKMEDAELETMFKNTSKHSHPKVWEILNTEIELRKVLEVNKKNNSGKSKKTLQND